MKDIKIGEWGEDSCRYATAKRDGHWLQIRDGRAYSSQDTDLTDKLRRFDWWLKAIKSLGPGQELLCEVYVPGKPASDVKSWPLETRLMVFAVPHLGDVSMLTVEGWCDRHGLEFSPWLEAPLPPRAELLAMAKRRGYEGWVLKEAHNYGWYRLKEVRTIELAVAGFRDGRGKYTGLVGSLLCVDATGREVAAVGGFDDLTRNRIDQDKDLGRIVEVAFQYVGAKGRLRHPRFVRWRDDKNIPDTVVSECVGV